MTRVEKLDISAFSIQSANAIIIKEAETCIYVPALFFMKVKDFIRACMPGVWLEPVVSHAYYSHGRQHFTKLLVNQ